MSENYYNNYQYLPQQAVQPYNCAPVNTASNVSMPPNCGPNAVNINIISPQAYGSGPYMTNPYAQNFYPVYGPNQYPNMPIYPQNYNNMIPQQPNNPSSAMNALNSGIEKHNSKTYTEDESVNRAENKPQKTKKITPLTDEYVKSLENYLNNDNPKIRLIGAKELMERFKEDENRADHPSLVPLLNKALKDTNSAVRFLALTALQLGYCVGNDETVQILKQIQANSDDKTGEDSLLASEILLKLAAPQQYEVPDNSPDNTQKNDKDGE